MFYLTQSPLGLENRRALLLSPASKVIPHVRLREWLEDPAERALTVHLQFLLDSLLGFLLELPWS